MEVKRLRTLATEIFKTLNNQNSNFMREIFYRSPNVSHKNRIYSDIIIKQQLLLIKV